MFRSTVDYIVRLLDNFFFDNCSTQIEDQSFYKKNMLLLFLKDYQVRNRSITGTEDWMNEYVDITFFEMFRMKKETFLSLFQIVMENDTHSLMKKKFRGGNYPIDPQKSFMIFLYYLAQKDSMYTIGERFGVVRSTVMNIVDAVLFIFNNEMKHKLIFWPSNENEIQYIVNGFKNYPGTLGASDGTHINIMISSKQHDSYVDRFLNHSITLMAICNANRVFTYIFVGFPGSAHDSRVFRNSLLSKGIERYGPNKYFKDVNKYHLIGDSAFPLKTWLMTRFNKTHYTEIEKQHNKALSSDRVVIEHAFGLLKGRWSRLQFIRTYNVCKATEIVVACCILHIYCLLNKDSWNGQVIESPPLQADGIPASDDNLAAQQKRNRIAREIFNR